MKNALRMFCLSLTQNALVEGAFHLWEATNHKIAGMKEWAEIIWALVFQHFHQTLLAATDEDFSVSCNFQDKSCKILFS